MKQRLWACTRVTRQLISAWPALKKPTCTGLNKYILNMTNYLLSYWNLPKENNLELQGTELIAVSSEAHTKGLLLKAERGE